MLKSVRSVGILAFIILQLHSVALYADRSILHSFTCAEALKKTASIIKSDFIIRRAGRSGEYRLYPTQSEQPIAYVKYHRSTKVLSLSMWEDNLPSQLVEVKAAILREFVEWLRSKHRMESISYSLNEYDKASWLAFVKTFNKSSSAENVSFTSVTPKMISRLWLSRMLASLGFRDVEVESNFPPEEFHGGPYQPSWLGKETYSGAELSANIKFNRVLSSLK